MMTRPEQTELIAEVYALRRALRACVYALEARGMATDTDTLSTARQLLDYADRSVIARVVARLTLVDQMSERGGT